MELESTLPAAENFKIFFGDVIYFCQNGAVFKKKQYSICFFSLKISFATFKQNTNPTWSRCVPRPTSGINRFPPGTPPRMTFGGVGVPSWIQ